jgi:prepilin-type N-terminal cleavage/methylation domain-containing protein
MPQMLATLDRNNNSRERGFTLIELLVVIGLVSILVGLSFVNLGRPQASTSLATSADTLVSDIKSQQLLAMAGDQGGVTTEQPHGVYVQAGQYILFAGSVYSSSDTNNFTVTLDPNLTIATTFSSTQVVFLKGTGEVQSFVNGSNTITLSSPALGTTKTITIDRFGAIVIT